MSAFLYYADDNYIDEKLKPYSWYLDHVIIGAEEARLPDRYVDKIRSVQSIKDQDQVREQDERSVYGPGKPAL